MITFLTLLLAQAIASPSPTPGNCPPTPVLRLTPLGPVPSSTPRSGVRDYAIVIVTVNPDSSIKNVALQVSTGDSGKDKSAINTAKWYKYKAATENCMPVEGTYRFVETIATIH